MPKIISFENVSKIYPNRSIALDSVSFDIEKGEFVYYVPENAILFYTSLTKEEIAQYPFVRFVDIFQPANKLSPELLSWFEKNKFKDESEKFTLLATVYKDIDSVKNKIESLSPDVNVYNLNNGVLKIEKGEVLCGDDSYFCF